MNRSRTAPGESSLDRRPLVRPETAASLLLVTRDDPECVAGGVETFAGDLLGAFCGSSVLAYGGAAGKRLLFNEARDARAAAAGLHEIARARGASVVVANGAAACGLPLNGRRPPLVTVYHGTYAGFGRVLGRRSPLHALWTCLVGASLERRAGRRADLVVAVSDRVAGEARRFYGVRARVIGNGVEVPARDRIERRAARRRWGIPPGARAVLFVGRPTWAKGFDRVRALARRRPSLTVLAVGAAVGGAGPANLRAMGEVRGARLAELYAAADCVILPSRYEGCSYVPLEAMAADRPVVVSAVGAFESAGRRPFGIVVAPGGAEGFIGAVDEVLGAPGEFSPRAYVAEQFPLDSFVGSWRRLIAEVTDGH